MNCLDINKTLRQWGQEIAKTEKDNFVVSVPLEEAIKKFSEHGINFIGLQVNIPSGLIDDLTLPLPGSPELEVTMKCEHKSALSSYIIEGELLDEFIDFESAGFAVREYRFNTTDGLKAFFCADKTAKDLQEFLAGIDTSTIIYVDEIYLDHPTTEYVRFTRSLYTLYHIQMVFKDGTTL